MTLLFGTNDRLLLRFVRTGDAKALARLFDRTATELLRVAGWLCGNRSDAEDLLQRTFVTVIEARGSYDAKRRAVPWLVGILGNHARKLREQRRRRPETRPPAAEPDPARTAADAEFAATVAQLRIQLGSPYAEVLDLHLAHDLNAKQIAERLGRPAGTVRTQLVRGLALLRERLPHGFVAGLLIASTSTAASVVTIRNTIVQHALAASAATATGIALGTTGGVLMTKNVAVAVATLLLLLGGGTWVVLRSNTNAGLAPSPAPVEGMTLPNARVPDPVAANALALIREAAVTTPAAEVLPEPGFAALIVRLRWQHDGSPAPAVGVRALPRPGTYVHEDAGLTDANGVVTLRRIRPGHCQVATAFTNLQTLDLVAGETRTIEATATRLHQVLGQVVDADNLPVADARIWVSDDGNWGQGFEVARSDVQGRFELSLAGYHYVGARKAGHTPSLLQARRAGDPRDVLLRLLGRGGSIRGHVRDDEGRAIAHAALDVGSAGGWNVSGATTYDVLVRPSPQRTITGTDGSFQVDGVEPGAAAVKAWAVGYGTTSSGVLVEPDKTAEISITLPRGASVKGVVRNRSRQSIAGASLIAGNVDTVEVCAESGGAGEYEVHDLPPGPCSLMATFGDTNASTSIELVAGQTAEWHPILEFNRRLHGRVRGPDGRGLADLRVGTAEPGYPVPTNSKKTDASGRFALSKLEAGPLDVLVTAGSSVLLRQSLGDEASDAELILTLSDAELPTAVVSGRVVDQEGTPVEGRFGILGLKFGCGEPLTTAADGTFRSEALPAGDYELSVEALGFGQLQLGTVTLAAHEHHVVPDIVLARAGRVDLTLKVDDDLKRCQIKLLRDDGECAAWLTTQGKVASAELPPDTYTAIAQGASGDVASTTFVVRSGETTPVNLFFVAARKLDIECRGNGSLTTDHRVSVLARDAGNTLVDAALYRCRYSTKDPNVLSMSMRLAGGSYSIEFRVSDGRTITRNVVVTTAADQPKLVVELPTR